MKTACLIVFIGLFGLLSAGAPPAWADGVQATGPERPVLLASDDDDHEDDRYRRHHDHGDRHGHQSERHGHHGDRERDGYGQPPPRRNSPFMSIMGLIGLVLVILAAG